MDTEAAFENEVLRVCRALFAKDRPYQGSIFLDEKERDGIFIGEDAVVVVEATVSTKLDKAKKDGRKLEQACNRLSQEHRFKAVKGYFVTREEPTAEQRRFIDGLAAPIVTCSLTQLRSMLIDSREYLSLRNKYQFGSAVNPGTGSTSDLGEYIDVQLTSNSSDSRTFTAADIANSTARGRTVVLLGDYGAGKSTTLRQVHNLLSERHRRASNEPFPVFLNLRDHQGQKEPDEALRRHANKVAFDSPTRLVRAWRAGEVHLILDGYDEIAATGWLGRTSDLRQIRHRSVELIRRFVDQTPLEVGITLSGRRHFFDNQAELERSLSLGSRNPTILFTDEFNPGQIQQYLTTFGWQGALPDWVPSRPLLLGYLVSSGLLQDLANGESLDPASGWDMLLDRICQREAKMEVGIDGTTIRQVVERLATIARGCTSGIGPIFKDDLARAFTEVCGYAPDEGSYVLLQRMPGLGTMDLSDGSRHFVDGDLADTARSGDLVRYIASAGVDSGIEQLQGTVTAQGPLGVSVSALRCRVAGVSGAQTLPMATRLKNRGASDALALDCVRVGLMLGGIASAPRIAVQEQLIDSLVFTDIESDLEALVFADCIIELLDITDYEGSGSLPRFERCSLGVVLGAASLSTLPPGHFVDCTFDSFDPSAKTTQALLATAGLTPRQRVLLTILKKTYLQRGTGRKDSALVRGLDDKHRLYVSELLALLLASGLLARGRSGSATVYFPVRGMQRRVRSILEAGASSQDPILTAAR